MLQEPRCSLWQDVVVAEPHGFGVWDSGFRVSGFGFGVGGLGFGV